jgi:hypothetical protein
MTGNSSFNIGEISNKEFSSTNHIKGLNSAIGDHSESQSIMKISDFDEEDEENKDQPKAKHPSESETFNPI